MEACRHQIIELSKSKSTQRATTMEATGGVVTPCMPAPIALSLCVVIVPPLTTLSLYIRSRLRLHPLGVGVAGASRPVARDLRAVLLSEGRRSQACARLLRERQARPDRVRSCFVAPCCPLQLIVAHTLCLLSCIVYRRVCPQPGAENRRRVRRRTLIQRAHRVPGTPQVHIEQRARALLRPDVSLLTS